GSLSLWARVATRDALIVSVDLPQWELDDPDEAVVCERLLGAGGPAQRVRLLRGDSHDPRIPDRASQLLPSRPLDFLFVDGDHTYAVVSQDFRDYSPFVRRGGVAAFHDVHPHSRGWGGEVPRFWDEIKEGYRHTELVASRDQNGFGIGVIWL